MDRELRRAAVLAAALVIAALSAFTAAVAGTGAFTRLRLSFDVDGAVTELYVQPGERPDISGFTAPEGSRLLYWEDASGAAADPAAPAEADAAYAAVLGPALAAEMEPWLDTDGYGLAHPDDYISGAELAAGLRAMFSVPVDVSGLEELETVTERELASALDGLLAPGELPELTGRRTMTRIEAADAVYTLYMDLSRGEGWGAALEYRVAAPDLDPLRGGAASMAACLDMDAAPRLDEGLHNIDGYLYRVDADGLFYMYTTAGGLYYGPNGRYSSGSEALDQLVAEALEPICAEYGTREEMLRAAYLYVRDNFDYLRRNYYEVGDEGWQIDEAVTMLSTHRGNCYNFAAAFWALARGLGYDAYAVAGTVGWDRSPHGWVIMYDEDGTRVIYDVELEMAYRYERGRTDTDLYAMYPDAAYSWNYIYGEQYE